MPSYPNFYENLAEARLRLMGNVVAYKGKAYKVVEIADNPDGKFRIYLDPIGPQLGWGRDKWSDFPTSSAFGGNLAAALDKWIEDNPDSGVIRRYMSSTGFNKYRPFALGNMNWKGQVIYVERTPTRNTSQGLKEGSVYGRLVTTAPSRVLSSSNKKSSSSSFDPTLFQVNLLTPEFADTVAGNYPTFSEVVGRLRDHEIINEGAAFDREFSVLRGPVETLCLCHKNEGVGLINEDNSLILGRQFKHLLETVSELGVFPQVTVR